MPKLPKFGKPLRTSLNLQAERSFSLMNRILRNERTRLHPTTLDALMRMALNVNDVKTWNPNPYTKQYEKENHFLCDSPLAGGRRKKMPTEEMEDYKISPYSTLF